MQSPRCCSPGKQKQMCLHPCHKFTAAWSHSSGMFEFHRLSLLTREARLINTFIYLGNNQGRFAVMKPGFRTRNATFAQSWLCLLFNPATELDLSVHSENSFQHTQAHAHWMLCGSRGKKALGFRKPTCTGKVTSPRWTCYLFSKLGMRILICQPNKPIVHMWLTIYMKALSKPRCTTKANCDHSITLRGYVSNWYWHSLI